VRQQSKVSESSLFTISVHLLFSLSFEDSKGHFSIAFVTNSDSLLLSLQSQGTKTKSHFSSITLSVVLPDFEFSSFDDLFKISIEADVNVGLIVALRLPGRIDKTHFPILKPSDRSIVTIIHQVR
jgi:hypothetical protein